MLYRAERHLQMTSAFVLWCEIGATLDSPRN
jgi:hypothetical protein